MADQSNKEVLDREKYLESLISTFQSLDDVIYKEIQNGTKEPIVNILDRQVEVVFKCISEFEPQSENERRILINFSVDMLQDRIENSRLASTCLDIIRRNAGPAGKSG